MRMTGLASLLLAIAALPVAAQDLPARKPGLWTMQMQMSGMPAGMGSQHCVDAKSDADLQRKALAGGPDQQCTQKSFKRTPGGFEMEAECTSRHGTAMVHAVAQGDFSKAYTIDNTVRFDPPRHGLRETQMKMTATHAGACPADLQPGQMRMTGMPGMPGMGGAPGGRPPNAQGMTPEQLRQFAEEMKKAQVPK